MNKVVITLIMCSAMTASGMRVEVKAKAGSPNTDQARKQHFEEGAARRKLIQERADAIVKDKVMFIEKAEHAFKMLETNDITSYGSAAEERVIQKIAKYFIAAYELSYKNDNLLTKKELDELAKEKATQYIAERRVSGCCAIL